MNRDFRLSIQLWSPCSIATIAAIVLLNLPSAVASGQGISGFGGYGEILYQFMDYGADRYSSVTGAPSDNRSIVDIPRFNLMFGYDFSPTISLTSEIEFEHLGTGSAMELEFDEGGEYESEVEKGGEVMLEALYFAFHPVPFFEAQVGHFVLPVGRANAAHLPGDYFTTVRPEGLTTLVPATWHETGISVAGTWKSLTASVFLVNGLDANMFSSANWIREGKQAAFEQTRFTSPAFAARINHAVRLGAVTIATGMSGYTGTTAANTSKPENMKSIDGRVSIVTAESEVQHRWFLLRADMLYGHLDDSYRITAINKSVSRNLGAPQTPVAKEAFAWAVEGGIDLLSLTRLQQSLFAFARYEQYNSMHTTEKGILSDARMNRSVRTAGVNWVPLPPVAVKLDYANRSFERGHLRSENTIGITITFSTLFYTKAGPAQ